MARRSSRSSRPIPARAGTPHRHPRYKDRAAAKSAREFSPDVWAVRGRADDERAQAQSPDRCSGPRRHPAGRAWPPAGSFCWKAARAPARPPWRCSFLLEGREGGRARPLRHPFRDGARAARSARSRMAGTSTTRSTSSSSCRPRACSIPDQQQSLLYSSDLELGETTKLIFDAVERTKAAARRARFAVGNPPPGAELAALSAADPGAEALFRPPRRHRAAARRPHGRHARQDGAQRRRTASSGWRRWRPTTAPSGGALRVIKYRAQGFRGGYHDFVIRRGGAHVFPRLVAAEHRRDFKRGRIGSGIPGLDALAGRRRRARLQHPADRPGRRGQEPDHPAVRGPGDPATAARPRCSSSTRNSGLLFDRAKPLGFDLAGHAGRRASGHHAARRGGAVARRIRAQRPRQRARRRCHGPS